MAAQGTPQVAAVAVIQRSATKPYLARFRMSSVQAAQPLHEPPLARQTGMLAVPLGLVPPHK
jgi:hypothetical protein